MFGTDDPVRVLDELRKLPENLVFRNAIHAKSVPALVIAKSGDLLPGHATALSQYGLRVETIDPSATNTQVADAIKKIVFEWRTDLLKELECVGYAVVIGPGRTHQTPPELLTRA